MKRAMMTAACVALLAGTAHAQTPALSPDKAAFRALYKELVETNTELSNKDETTGTCTTAAKRMAAHLIAAGYPAADVKLWTAPEHPLEGGLFAVLHGTDPKAKAMLLLAHIDVVEAKRADWTRDPFTLIEEGGYFYGRGTSDDKAEASVWVDTMVRLKQEGFKPKRDIKIALTCGEETAGAFNGAEWLANHERKLIDAEFALNEGAGGRLDKAGKPVILNIQAGEKFPQNYQLEVVNPGGHSSRPTRVNAIDELAHALIRIEDYQFPIEFTDASRAYFTQMAKLTPQPEAGHMLALLKDPANKAAAEAMRDDPGANGMLHTTCIPTMLSGGHATNAQPQRATAVVNCRIFPGETVEAVRAKLDSLSADPGVKVTVMETRSPISLTPPALTPQIMGPVRTVAAEIWPGTPIVPTLTAGGTDGAFLIPAGIPTYGLTGMFGDPDGNGVHGLNERIRVKSLYDGRDFLYRVVKLYAAQG
jgi:acetylornithine deacetylase/succinyl-diaminopimelate desuccinylase-like protein